MVSRALSIFLLGCLLVSCIRTEEIPASPNKCPGFAKNSQGQKLIWTAGFPIRLNVDAKFPTIHRPAISSAIAAWNAKMNSTVFILEGELPGSTPALDAKNVIYWTTTWTEATDKQAHSYLRWNNERISEADMIINGQNFSFSATPSPGQYDLASIITHELGHFLGLAHSQDTTSIMQEFVPDETVGQISERDAANVKCAYSFSAAK